GSLGWAWRERADSGRWRRVEPWEAGLRVETVEPVGPGAQDRGPSSECLGVLLARRVERLLLSRRGQEREQPVELVGERCKRSRRTGRAGWTVLRAEETPTQVVDCLPSSLGAFAELVSAGVDQVRDRAQGRARRALLIGATLRRPEEHGRADAGTDGEPPSLEPIGDRRVRRRDRHRQDEREDRRSRSGREVAADRAGEEDGETNQGHCPRAEPGRARARGSGRDEQGAGAAEAEIGEEASPGGAAELDEHEDCEGAEGGQKRGLRLLDDLVR